MRAFPLILLLLAPVMTAADTKWAPFLGTWRGVCADGSDFVLVTLTPAADGGLAGTVRLANMRGGDDGSCAAIVDPPSDKHALPVSDARISGSTLTFRAARRMEFALGIESAGRASLRFIGTASEENPWRLVRKNGN